MVGMRGAGCIAGKPASSICQLCCKLCKGYLSLYNLSIYKTHLKSRNSMQPSNKRPALAPHQTACMSSMPAAAARSLGSSSGGTVMGNAHITQGGVDGDQDFPAPELIFPAWPHYFITGRFHRLFETFNKVIYMLNTKYTYNTNTSYETSLLIVKYDHSSLLP